MEGDYQGGMGRGLIRLGMSRPYQGGDGKGTLYHGWMEGNLSGGVGGELISDMEGELIGWNEEYPLSRPPL